MLNTKNNTASKSKDPSFGRISSTAKRKTSYHQNNFT